MRNLERNVSATNPAVVSNVTNINSFAAQFAHRSSDDDCGGARVVDATTSKNPQMLLMEAVAGRNLKLIKLVLKNPLLSSRDIHAALMNATAKGGYEIVRVLVGKASEKSLAGCLLIACKLANVDLIKLLIPLVKQARSGEELSDERAANTTCDHTALVANASFFVTRFAPSLVRSPQAGLSRAIIAVAKTGQTQVLGLFFGGGADGVGAGFDHHEVQRMFMSCVGKGMAPALEVIVPLVNREWKGEVGKLTRTYKQALTSACAKGHVEAARVLVGEVCVDDLQSVLGLCAGRGDSELVELVLKAMKTSSTPSGFYEASCRHAMEVARGKGKMDIVGLLSVEAGGLEKKGSYSAKR